MGITMNSWKSIELRACTPPLTTLNIGTGSTWAFTPPRYWKSGRSRSIAAALAVASETARMALAPRRLLLSVPSRSIRAASTSRWLVAS